MYACLLLICFVNFVSYTNISDTAHLNAVADARQYIEMSQHTFAQVFRPFAFRMLTPWIVHNVQLIPGVRLDYAWMLVTFLATYLALVWFFKVLFDRLRLSLFTSTLATMLLAFTYYYTLFNFADFWLVDPLNNLCYVLAIYFLLGQRLLPFAIVIIVGMVNKESVLYLAPLYPLLALARAGTWRNRAVLSGALLTVACGGFYLAFQAWAQARVGGNEGYNAFSWEVVRFALNSRKGTEHLAVFGVFHFLWFVFAYGIYWLYRRHGARHDLLVVSAVLLVACLFSRLFATDTERVFVMMAPALIAVCAVIFDAFRSETERLATGFLAVVYVAINLGWVEPGRATLAADLVALAIFVGLVALRDSQAPWRRRELRPAEPPEPGSGSEPANGPPMPTGRQ